MEIDSYFDTNIVKKVKIQMYFCEKYYNFFVKPSAIRLIKFKKKIHFYCPDKTINLNNMPKIVGKRIILNFEKTKKIKKILSCLVFPKEFFKTSKFEMDALYSIKFLGYEFNPCDIIYIK